ncbi:Major phosphate-irrepressible acid phosphatase precursor [Serratia quinivorans]|uniref:acid phosphatase n=1 Tax=Serratia quinivorans TaxID=137545 RepID=UPI002177482D|nr:phosphatase PAP2 family protein [Serratia quinivorans]CAI1594262.1 Major phosphate-irrepressible acid phosphatase precursor [Serratia quinivorans]CAI1633027.1 Major phosphate-irrepressible acid phosphatase precursor [Serratia quinivorans]
MNKTLNITTAIFFIVLIPDILFAHENSQGSARNSFLSDPQAPDSLSILPLPPRSDSIAFLMDKAAYEQGRSLTGTDRWHQAIADANLSDDNIGKPFEKALGVDISPSETPATYQLLKKIRIDAGRFATASAKRYYMRPRPFMFFNSHTCTPEDEVKLRMNGSYPSGHTTLGWTTALVLAEIRPERQNLLLQRGYEFGQSRVICGAHWQSDVDAGRIMGAAVFARLNADAQFIIELNDAKKEITSKTVDLPGTE